jgi:hypothetical protein
VFKLNGRFNENKARIVGVLHRLVFGCHGTVDSRRLKLVFTCYKLHDFSNRWTTCTRQPTSLYKLPMQECYWRFLGRLWFLTSNDLTQHYIILLHIVVGYLASQYLEQSEVRTFTSKSKLLTCSVILPKEYMSHSVLSETAASISSSSGTSNNSAAAHRILPLMELVR